MASSQALFLLDWKLVTKNSRAAYGYTHMSKGMPLVWTKCKEYVPSITHPIYTCIPTVATYIKGKIGNYDHSVSLLLDWEASWSIVRKDYTSGKLAQPIEGTQLVSTDGRTISPCGTTVMAVILGNLQVYHKFIVLDTLSTPVILRCDFLTKHNLIVDFSQQAKYYSNNPSFTLDMPLVRMSSCSTLALDDESLHASNAYHSNEHQYHTNR